VNRDRRVTVRAIADRRAFGDAWPDAGVAVTCEHDPRAGREQQRMQLQRDAPVEVRLAIAIRSGGAGGVAFLLAVAIVDQLPDLLRMSEVAAVVPWVDRDHASAQWQLRRT